MTSIETQRLIIRNFSLSDWPGLQRIVMEKEASEYAVYDSQFPTAAEEVKGIAQWFAGGDAFMAVCLKPDQLIGYVALNQSGGAAYDLGYCFHPAYHGQGYATEACSAIIAYAFDVLSADKITSGTAEANIPSLRLLERLCFRVIWEGMTSFRQDAMGKPVEFKGLAFELTKAEWVSRQNCKE